MWNLVGSAGRASFEHVTPHAAVKFAQAKHSGKFHCKTEGMLLCAVAHGLSCIPSNLNYMHASPGGGGAFPATARRVQALARRRGAHYSNGGGQPQVLIRLGCCLFW